MTSKRSALVTGSSTGLGSAIVDALLEDGWNVLGLARRVYQPSKKFGDNYQHIVFDLSQVNHLESLASRVEEKLVSEACSELLLVNNAGVLEPTGGVSHAAPDSLAMSYAVNLIAPSWLMDFFARRFSNTPTTIVNISSGAAASAYPGWGFYCASKAALQMAMKVCAEELDKGAMKRAAPLRLISYAPGVVDTAMQEAVRKSSPESFPLVERFVTLHKEGKLVSPKGSASFLMKLMADAKQGYTEARYSD